MITLLLSLFASGGGVAVGSILKTITGFADSYSHRKEISEHRKILKTSKNDASTLAFQKAMFGDGNSKEGTYATHTRRMLALIGVSTLAVVTIHCVLFPYDAFITLPSVASSGEGGSWSILGLITIPRSNQPIQLTLGHLALMNLGSLQMILGFYFAGRK